jgi:hypothetical protein
MEQPCNFETFIATAVDSMLLAATNIDSAIYSSIDGDEIASLINLRDLLRDYATALSPPGKTPKDEGGATVYYIEQERSKRRLGH